MFDTTSIGTDVPTPWNDILDDELRAFLVRRESRSMLGKRPALIAVDLYDLVYDGGPRPVTELMAEFDVAHKYADVMIADEIIDALRIASKCGVA